MIKALRDFQEAYYEQTGEQIEQLTLPGRVFDALLQSCKNELTFEILPLYELTLYGMRITRETS